MVQYAHVTRAREALQALALPYRVIFVSKASRTVWQGLERTGNFCVIHNGFDHEHFNARLGRLTRTAARQQLGIADDQIVLLAMGTVCERKRQHDLIQGFAALPAASAARLRLLIVGDRPSAYSDQLHRLIAELPPTRRAQVTVVPETSAVAPFWRAADLFCCTAHIESFPRTLQEAMACGLPIITTPVYGIRELVRPGLNAEYYPPGDITALATAINRLVTDDALRQYYAANAPVVLAGTLTFGEMIDEYAKLFGEARITAASALPAPPVPVRFLLGNLAAAAKVRLATFADFGAKVRRISR